VTCRDDLKIWLVADNSRN